MPSQPYTRVTERFRCNGIDLNSPVDSVRPGFYPVVENVRSYTDGIIQPRQGLTTTSTGIATKTPSHTIRRLNDPVNSSWTRIVGTGDAIGYGQGILTQATYNGANLTYDGNPLVLVPFRPDQAIAPFMYIGAQVGNDTGSFFLRQMKINRTGTVHQIGVPAPLNPPTVELGAFTYAKSGTVTLGPNFQSNVGWTVDATVLTTLNAISARIPAAQTTTAARYDSGTTGWCSLVVPAASMSVVGVGMQVDFVVGGVTTGTLLVHEVYPGTSATITVSSILYDSGTTGLCTIQPSKSPREIQRNAIVLLNGGTNYFRILSTTKAADGTVSFRVNTGATTIAATNSVAISPSIRVYDDAGLNFASGGTDSLTMNTLDVTSGTVAGTGWINVNVASDLTVTNTGATGRALLDDDYIHLSLRFTQSTGLSALSRITGGRIMFNVDSEATPTYTKNYYARPFTPSDLTASTQGGTAIGTTAAPNQTAIDNRRQQIANRQVDRALRREQRRFGINEGSEPISDFPPAPIDVIPGDDPNIPPIDDPSRSQTGTGDNQWHELRFRVGDLKQGRVGTDASRTLSNINGFRLELTLAAGNAITVNMNSLTVWGTYPLDIADLGIPYIYRFRYRSTVTGARSNYSPPNLSGVLPYREQVIVTPGTAGRAGIPPEVDKIDFERVGGALTNWTYVGTIDSGGTQFTDQISDEAAFANIALSEGDTNYQPWPIRGAPVTGTLSTVAGTMGKATVANLNPDWAKGTPIRVQRTDGSYVETTIRRVMSGNQLMEFADSIGSSTANVTYNIVEPLITSTPLPTMWTWEDRMFAVGDTSNPGTLYYSNGNNPDGTQDTFFLEITSPSEPLMNGISFNGKNYVWSTERMFELEQIIPGQFIAVAIPGNKGLVSIYGLAVGERLWYVSRDGIYQTGGGDSVSITDETLRPFFVQEGNVGTATNGFNPPDFTKPNTIRLSYYDGYLYFIYTDTGSTIRCLTYKVRGDKPGWWPDVYDSSIGGVRYLYGEEGEVYTAGKPTSAVHALLACGGNAVTGQIYRVNGAADETAAIAGHVQTQYFDAQDRRADKRWGDLILDADPNNTTLNVSVYTNGSTGTSLTLSPATMTGAARAQQIVDISAGSDVALDYARNIALNVTWSSTSATPKLYLWEPAYTTRPETMDQRATTWDDDGFEGDKYFQGVEVQANTANVTKSVVVEFDGSSGNVGETLSIQHNGNVQKAYPFHPPFIAHTVRLHSTDAVTWQLYKTRWIWQPESPAADHWETQQTSLGADQFVHLKAGYITLRSTQNVILTVTRTDDGTATNYTIPTTSGLREKVYVPFQAPVSKGKAFSFIVSSTSTGGTFRLYRDDTTILAKPWASEDQFTNRNPFGAPHGDGKAPI